MARMNEEKERIKERTQMQRDIDINSNSEGGQSKDKLSR